MSEQQGDKAVEAKNEKKQGQGQNQKKQAGPKPGQPKKPQEALQKGEDLGITVEKEANLSAWFIQVIEKAELISYTDISGCFGKYLIIEK